MQENAYFVSITESWLDDGVTDAEISIPGYSVYRSDRKCRSRGGTCVYIRSDISTAPSLKYSNNAVEMLVMKVASIDSILVFIYRPPDTTIHEWRDAVQSLENEIENIQAHGKFPNILITGDINFPNAKWEEINAGICNGNSCEQNQIRILMEFMSKYFIAQYINQATRSENILDIVMSNNDHMIANHKFTVNSKYSDHCTITSELNIILNQTISHSSDKCISDTLIPMFDLRDDDEYKWKSYNSLLNEKNWFMEKRNCQSIDEKVNVLYRNIEDTISQVFSLKQRTHKNNVPKDIRKAFKKKKSISDKMRTTKHSDKLNSLKNQLIEIENKISKGIRDKRIKAESKVIDKVKTDTKPFFKYAKSMAKTNESIGPLVNKDDKIIADDQGMAEVLSQQYKSVFSEPADEVTVKNSINENFHKGDKEELKQIYVTSDNLWKVINKLKNEVSPRPDGVSSKCYKN